ncbi:unnamed protein product [Ostreobium quekettii]|uniref:NF-X1-type domain-containing protein n=1 Tax=Ostreobium quekettii TaxID=121088 RepID=A0A8S1J3Z7_9CHLO|nr:unnamed protein product [Ostreobium quekettii]
MMAGCSSSDAQQCPPCCQPVTVSCLGGHTEQTVQCHAAQDFSCGQPCGRVLQCGKHHCQKECHRAGPETCSSCSLACDGVCHSGHACPLPCHAGDCPPCEEPLRLACHCGKTTVELPCHEHLLATEAGTLGQRLCCEKPCHKQLPLCGHPCRSSCHEGNCQGTATCREVVTVFCRCKSKRESWTCGGVQEALVARGLHPGYSEASKPRLLDCDDSCLQKRRKDRHEGRGNEGREGGAEGAEFPMEGLSQRALPREGRDAAGRSQTRKLTREERRIAAEKREAEKKRRAMYSRIWRRFLKSLPVVLGLILGFILFRLLAGSS